MLKLLYHICPNLSKLAWLAEFHIGDENVHVYCGSAVETGVDFFVSGVWSDEFAEHGFLSSDFFCGTGAVLDGDKLVFATPSHDLERLLLFQSEDVIAVSNSFPFLTSFLDLRLDKRVDQYEAINCSILKGPAGLVERIPLEGGKFVRQFIVSLLTVDNELHVLRSPRPKVPPFLSFSDYWSRLQTAISRIGENACSEARLHTKYQPIATISRGYDSPVGAMLARQIGCTHAVTLCGKTYDADNGEPIARAMGYEQVTVRDQYSYRSNPGCIDAQYFCDGEQGTDLQLNLFEDVFRDHLVFFGSRGSYWSKQSNITDEFEMKGYFFAEACLSRTENALKNGYIEIPVPTYGASQASSIREISNSPEMEPYTLHCQYDKPIPRRILEEGGVPRQLFGQVKHGGGFSCSFDLYKSFMKKLSREGVQSFERYLRSEDAQRHRIRRFFRLFPFLIQARKIYLNAAFGALGIHLGLHSKPPKMSNPGLQSDVVFWAHSLMQDQYRRAMQD